MKNVTEHKMWELAFKALGKWGLLLSACSGAEFEDVQAAAPWVPLLDLPQLYAGSHLFYTFETEEECVQHYLRVVGEDGPTASNPYNGPGRVYALMFNDQGQPVTENT